MKISLHLLELCLRGAIHHAQRSVALFFNAVSGRDPEHSTNLVGAFEDTDAWDLESRLQKSKKLSFVFNLGVWFGPFRIYSVGLSEHSAETSIQKGDLLIWPPFNFLKSHKLKSIFIAAIYVPPTLFSNKNYAMTEKHHLVWIRANVGKQDELNIKFLFGKWDAILAVPPSISR